MEFKGGLYRLEIFGIIYDVGRRTKDEGRTTKDEDLRSFRALSRSFRVPFALHKQLDGEEKYVCVF